ncbi:unnamed protein product [Blepharisma stoltei]|uniref:Kinesin light chain n=1 Tax=Blepharisma stoltei TaxID=1481888 RepID=A0AAU9KD12_9CILI|nr:unnamed protein product [Blepharisma stoltei]
MEEHPMSISDRICAELEEKNRVLGDYVKDREEIGDKEGVIQVRIHQLALCKVLANVHNRHKSILVEAHTNLGESYLNNQYFEQALEHLTTALSHNGRLVNEDEGSKPYHTHILTLLGKCYLEAGGIDDSLSLLEKALKMNKAMVGEDNLSNSQIYSTLAQVWSKKKNHAKALDCLTTVWELHEKHYGMKHESLTQIYIDMAKVYKKQGDLNNAIDTQKRALNLMGELDIHTDVTAEVALKLSQWLQDSNNYPEALDALRNAEHIYEYNHSMIHKSTAKVKRNICMLLLKAEEYEEALQECYELEEVDKSLHGENSQQYGKDLKVIGTILMILNRYAEAQDYFNKALAIFSKIKNSKKTVKEIKQKLQTIADGLKDNPSLFSKRDERVKEESHDSTPRSEPRSA